MTMTQTDTPRYRDRTTLNHRIPTIFFTLLLLGNIACADANTGLNGNQETPGGSFNLGSTASASDIAAWDLDMDPSGSGAPIGSGLVEFVVVRVLDEIVLAPVCPVRSCSIVCLNRIPQRSCTEDLFLHG